MLAALVYRHKDFLKALEDLIYIECSSSRKSIGRLDDRRVEQGPPIKLIIDPNSKSVRRWDKSRLGKTDRYSDDEIVASWEDEKATAVLELDRVAGSYRMELRLKEDRRAGRDQWGKCEKVDPGKKF